MKKVKYNMYTIKYNYSVDKDKPKLVFKVYRLPLTK